MTHNAVKGVQDILPPDVYIWHKIESAAREVFSIYGFQEIKIPIMESTDVFIRSIGENTDIVEKEMYTFNDKGGRSITLRPEGTASAVRCYVGNQLYTLPAPQKYFYSGPMFRYERPQKGRFRQFYQIGVETFGVEQPSLDAEIIAMLKTIFDNIGLKELSFEINSIGCGVCRADYKTALLLFFEDKLDGFCPDCIRRYHTNPLRILDCKIERCVELKSKAPSVKNYLCKGCASHFNELLLMLEMLSIPHTVNTNLVRGIDYYTKTTFEVTSEHLGAQKAVAAGGRYDGLVKEFGGPDTPAIGFAIGMERLASLLKEVWTNPAPTPKVFIATLGKKADIQGLKIAMELRRNGIWAEVNYGGASLKNQLRKADKIGVQYAIIIGDNELELGKVQWKNMKKGQQGEIDISSISQLFMPII